MRYREREAESEPAYSPLFVKVVRVSQRAALCELTDYDNEQLWVPFSVMDNEGRDLSVGEEVDLMVEDWFLKNNGIDLD